MGLNLEKIVYKLITGFGSGDRTYTAVSLGLNMEIEHTLTSSFEFGDQSHTLISRFKSGGEQRPTLHLISRFKFGGDQSYILISKFQSGGDQSYTLIAKFQSGGDRSYTLIARFQSGQDQSHALIVPVNTLAGLGQFNSYC